jgi:Uma2 family endonuclease
MAVSIKIDPAPRMSVEEFLVWDSGDDLRYELVEGVVIAQSAPARPHGRLVANFSYSLASRLRAAKRPCAPEAGSVLRIDRRWTVRAPDLLVRCGASARDADTPVLAIEVLSPSNSASEMARKRDDYALVGIMEVLEVEQDLPEIRVYRREGDRWVIETARGLDGVLALSSLGLEMPLAELYADVLPDDAPLDATADA